jgi:hypothetical protein
MRADRDQEWNSDDRGASDGATGVADTDICRDSRAYDRAWGLANNSASGASDRAPDAAPTLAPLNLSPASERAARLSAAKAAKAIFRVNIDKLGFLALGSVAGCLDAAEQSHLAAARGSRRRQVLEPNASRLMRAEPLHRSLLWATWRQR